MLPPSKVLYYYSVGGTPVVDPQESTSIDASKKVIEIGKDIENRELSQLNV